MKMDKEMQAKVEEFLKKNSKRKLSDSELDQVVGGDAFANKGVWAPWDFRIPQFANMTWEEGASFISALYDNFGFDVTADWLKENWLKTRDWDTYLEAGGPIYCAQKMWSVIYVAGGGK